ncbi:MAG: DUF6152 family protein [Beijerinckiaceae bacterium]
MLTRRTILGATVCAAVAPARAHHGWGSYDAANPVTVRGPIKMLKFENPHCHVEVESGGKKWECTLAPPFRMTNRGATEAILKVGTPVVVFGYPSRSAPTEMRAEWIEVAGKRFELR